MRPNSNCSIIICMLVIIGVSDVTEARIPQTMSYQAVLTDGGGGAMPDGSYDMTFKIFTVSSGGTEIWTESQTVAVTGGIFSVILGSKTPLSVAFDVPYWLGVSINGGSELFPRRELTSAGYALNTRSVADSVVTGVMIKPGQVVRSLNGLTDDVILAAGNNVSITTTADTIIVSSSGGGSSLDWSLTGNAGTTAGVNFLGTSDDEAMEIRVNSSRVTRFEPDGSSPNIIAGHFVNSVTPGVHGAVISGAGSATNPNRILDNFGVVGGGDGNEAGSDDLDVSNATYATVGGGVGNSATGAHTTVAGGRGNTADLDGAAVGGGEGNGAVGFASTVSGGYQNSTGADGAAVGGGANNSADGELSAIVGGFENSALGQWAAVGGGSANTVSGSAAVIAGGANNQTNGNFAVVGGGSANYATAAHSTVSGGQGNDATSGWAAVGGGWENNAAGMYATIGGGEGNYAGHRCAVAGGQGNTASSGYSTVSGGANNSASGYGSTVVGGGENNAGGRWSIAGGRRVNVLGSHDGAIVLADTSDFYFSSAAANEFAVRATGGVRLITGIDGAGVPIAGATLAAGSGTWGILSDRNAKEHFVPVDVDQVLEHVARLSISTWNYKSQDESIRHMGVMAQDFHAAFGLGADDSRITTVDADGVSLAAIQALNERLTEALEKKDAEIAALEKRIAQLESLVSRIGRTK